jgi:hypothetical protein
MVNTKTAEMNGPKRLAGDNFEPVNRPDGTYPILQGSCMSPLTCSVLQNNQIDGLLLDTRWKGFRGHVTTFLMAVDHNVGIPIGLAFGIAETADLYEQLYSAFSQRFGLDLSRYILESDQ